MVSDTQCVLNCFRNHAAAPAGIPAQQIGEVALWLAALLTAITGWDYLRAGLRHLGAAP